MSCTSSCDLDCAFLQWLDMHWLGTLEHFLILHPTCNAAKIKLTTGRVFLILTLYYCNLILTLLTFSPLFLVCILAIGIDSHDRYAQDGPGPPVFQTFYYSNLILVFVLTTVPRFHCCHPNLDYWCLSELIRIGPVSVFAPKLHFLLS